MSVYPLQVHIVRSSSPEAETTLTLSKRVRSNRFAHLCGVLLRSPRVCVCSCCTHVLRVVGLAVCRHQLSSGCFETHWNGLC